MSHLKKLMESSVSVKKAYKTITVEADTWEILSKFCKKHNLRMIEVATAIIRDTLEKEIK